MRPQNDAQRTLALAIHLLYSNSRIPIRTLNSIRPCVSCSGSSRRLSTSAPNQAQQEKVQSAPRIAISEAGKSAIETPKAASKRQTKGKVSVNFTVPDKNARYKPPTQAPASSLTKGSRKPGETSTAISQVVAMQSRLKKDPKAEQAKKEIWNEEKARRDAAEAARVKRRKQLPPAVARSDQEAASNVKDKGKGKPKAVEGKKMVGSVWPPRTGSTAEAEKILDKEAAEEAVEEDEDGSKGAPKPEELEEILRESPPHIGSKFGWNLRGTVVAAGSLKSTEIKLTVEKPERHMVVNRLRDNLVGIPFSPGIHFMQDPRTGIFNFDPDMLYEIPQPEEFAYDRVPGYSKPSTHAELADLAKQSGCTYAGSTSTLTKTMSQIYFLLSRNKALDMTPFSKAFADERNDFSFGCMLPACLELTKSKEGVWYIDSDKQYDTNDNILSDLGVVMEKMLTASKEDFAKCLKINPSDEEALKQDLSTEAFHYQRGSKLMMRSQLDCYDPRLPGTGVFDIKTRACWPIRYDRANHVSNSKYEIFKEKGFSQSYEREYYDLLRATMLKYNLQARIGNMDGIFVAYHNTARIFGFQYLPLSELDERIYGSTEMGQHSFKLCVALTETIMDQVTQSFPDNDRLSVVIKYVQPDVEESGTLAVFAVPKEDNPDKKSKSTSKEKPIKAFYITLDNYLDGERIEGPLEFSNDDVTRRKHQWEIKWKIAHAGMDERSQKSVRSAYERITEEQIAMLSVSCPEGFTAEQMMEKQLAKHDGESAFIKWKGPDSKVLMMRKEAKDSAAAYAKRKAQWRPQEERKTLSWVPAN